MIYMYIHTAKTILFIKHLWLAIIYYIIIIDYYITFHRLILAAEKQKKKLIYYFGLYCFMRNKFGH